MSCLNDFLLKIGMDDLSIKTIPFREIGKCELKELLGNRIIPYSIYVNNIPDKKFWCMTYLAHRFARV